MTSKHDISHGPEKAKKKARKKKILFGDFPFSNRLKHLAEAGSRVRRDGSLPYAYGLVKILFIFYIFLINHQ